jgi:hypothetical protein
MLPKRWERLDSPRCGVVKSNWPKTQQDKNVEAVLQDFICDLKHCPRYYSTAHRHSNHATMTRERYLPRTQGCLHQGLNCALLIISSLVSPLSFDFSWLPFKHCPPGPFDRLTDSFLWAAGG